MIITDKIREQISQNVRASGVLSGKRKMSDKEWRKIQKAAELLKDII